MFKKLKDFNTWDVNRGLYSNYLDNFFRCYFTMFYWKKLHCNRFYNIIRKLFKPL